MAACAAVKSALSLVLEGASEARTAGELIAPFNPAFGYLDGLG